MNEERRRIGLDSEEWRAPKRECPVPKPGGLVGQVLGIKRESNEDEETSVKKEVEKVRRR